MGGYHNIQLLKYAIPVAALLSVKKAECRYLGDKKSYYTSAGGKTTEGPSTKSQDLEGPLDF